MMVLRLAFRNLWRHPRRTVFISVLMVIGTVLISITTAVLDNATKGLETSFIGSLTGHLALGAPAEESYGLFGSEVPIVSDYEAIPPIDDGTRLFPLLKTIPGLSAYTGVVSSIANLSLGPYGQKSVVFGVDPESYFAVLPDIEIVWGDTGALKRGGMFLNETWARLAEKSLQRPLQEGESLVAAVISQGSFRLRTFHLAGVYRYKAPSEVLDRIVLADASLVRSLVNYTLGNMIPTSGSRETAMVSDTSAQNFPGDASGTDSIDSLFSTVQDVEKTSESGLTVQAVETILQDTTQRDDLILEDSAAWSFILVRKADGTPLSSLKNQLSQVMKKNGIDVRLLDWFTAAGSNVLMLLALQAAFNGGVLFLVAGAFMILINSLVISVLERTGEIGTLRALGAQRLFIVRLVFSELVMVTLGSALTGIMISAVSLVLVSQAGIVFKNPLLISLFGGSVLRPRVSAHFVYMFITGTVVTSILACIYPVHLALSVSPREAINNGEE